MGPIQVNIVALEFRKRLEVLSMGVIKIREGGAREDSKVCSVCFFSHPGVFVLEIGWSLSGSFDYGVVLPWSAE